uniref:Putative ovule protein n=1 Tax=Solanum chacoense TaxID=4108 RepID=A0A0V0GQ99_SOLCH
MFVALLLASELHDVIYSNYIRSNIMLFLLSCPLELLGSQNFWAMAQACKGWCSLCVKLASF